MKYMRFVNSKEASQLEEAFDSTPVRCHEYIYGNKSLNLPLVAVREHNPWQDLPIQAKFESQMRPTKSSQTTVHMVAICNKFEALVLTKEGRTDIWRKFTIVLTCGFKFEVHQQLNTGLSPKLIGTYKSYGAAHNRVIKEITQ